MTELPPYIGEPTDDLFSAANMFKAIHDRARGHKVASVAIVTGTLAVAGGIAAANIHHKRKNNDHSDAEITPQIDDVSGNI